MILVSNFDFYFEIFFLNSECNKEFINFTINFSIFLFLRIVFQGDKNAPIFT